MKYLKYYENIDFDNEDWEEEPDHIKINPNGDNYYVAFSFYYGGEGIEFEDLVNYDTLVELLTKRNDDYGDNAWEGVEEFTNVLQLACSVCKLEPDDDGQYKMTHLDFNIVDTVNDPLDDNGHLKEFIHKDGYNDETLFVYVGNDPDRTRIKNVCDTKYDDIRRESLNPIHPRSYSVDLRFNEEMLDGPEAYANYLYFNLSIDNNGNGPYKLVDDW